MSWSNIREQLAEFEAEPLQAIAYLHELRARARDGVVQQKVSVKDGVLDVVEKYPAIELSATVEMSKLARYIIERADAETSPDSAITITISEVF